MSLLDRHLFFNEDQDLEEHEMPEFTPVDPQHLLELHQRGMLELRETLSHRGWHHRIVESSFESGVFNAYMWDGPTGDERWCYNVAEFNFWS